MTTLKTALRVTTTYFNILMGLISPLFIILFVVGAVVVLDRFGQFNAFINGLKEDSRVTAAVVTRAYDDELGSVGVEYDWKEGQTFWGALKAAYHPPGVLRGLQVGQRVTIRYPDPPRDGGVVLEEYYPQVQYSYDFVSEPLIVMLVCWVLIVFYPRFLYYGFSGEALPLKPLPELDRQ